MAWDGEHDYKRRDEYSDKEWDAMDHSDKMAQKQYWGTEQHLKGAQGGNKEWMDYQKEGGDKVQMWENLSKGDKREYRAEHGKGAQKKYRQDNADNFFVAHDPENQTDWSEEAFYEGLDPWMKERYEKGTAGYKYEDTVANSRARADEYQAKQQEAWQRAQKFSQTGSDEDPDTDPGTDPDDPPVDPLEDAPEHAQFAQGVTNRARANAAPRIDTAEVRSKIDKRSQYFMDQATLQGVNIWGDRDHTNSSRPSFVLPDSAGSPDAPDFKAMYEETLAQLKQYKL